MKVLRAEGHTPGNTLSEVSYCTKRIIMKEYLSKSKEMSEEKNDN